MLYSQGIPPGAAIAEPDLVDAVLPDGHGVLQRHNEWPRHPGERGTDLVHPKRSIFLSQPKNSILRVVVRVRLAPRFVEPKSHVPVPGDPVADRGPFLQLIGDRLHFPGVDIR